MSPSVADISPVSSDSAPRLSLAERLSDPSVLTLADRISSSPASPVSDTGSPIQTDNELPSPTETVVLEPLEASMSPLQRFPGGNREVHESIPMDERTMARVTTSIGHTFARSLNDATHGTEEVTARIRAYGGHETMFYNVNEISTLTRPFSNRRFNLDLINRLVQPSMESILSIRNEVNLEPGQLVWRFVYTVTMNGWSHSYDPRGPFIIIARQGPRYVLVDTGGYLLPAPVPAYCLIPAISTWHAMRLPADLARSNDVQDVFNSWSGDEAPF